MSVKQILGLSEQTVVRSALDAEPAYLAYPVKGALEPTPEYKEETANEWRGQEVAQGNTGDNEERTSTAWKFAWDSRMYPGPTLAMLFKYLFGGFADPVALSAPDAAASKQIFYTVGDMYGEGCLLADQAIAIHPQTKKGSSTYSQDYIGGRITEGDLAFKGGASAEMKLSFIGGPWIGAPEQAALSGLTVPTALALKSTPQVYIGAGANLTGAGPIYTDFAPGTMPVARPDDLSIKISTGIEDTYKMNGYAGPSVTERKKAWTIGVDFTVDFLDPSSGWSSYDAWAARFGGMTFLPFMMILDSGQIIPSCSAQTYQFGLYLPRMKVVPDVAQRKSDGSRDKIKVKLESRVDPAVNIAAFAKLIY